LLPRVPAYYRFHDRDYDIRVCRQPIGFDESGRVFDVRYSAHLMEPFDMEVGLMQGYHMTFRKFMAATCDPAYVINFKLNVGEVAVFDNRRILHGRSAFDASSGHPLLKGFYVDRGEFDSRIRLLKKATG